MTEKGPGDIDYPLGKPKNLKKMPDGNPYPYERGYAAESGVQDDDKVEGKQEFKYKPSIPSFEGDSGLGGSGK